MTINLPDSHMCIIFAAAFDIGHLRLGAPRVLARSIALGCLFVGNPWQHDVPCKKDLLMDH